MSGANRAVWYAFAGITIVGMLSPLVILVVFAFNASPLLSFPWSGFTLDWAYGVLERPQFVNALWNSLIVAAIVGATSTVVGTMAAIGLVRARSRFATVVASGLTLPVMVPPLMLGIMLLTYYVNWVGVSLGLHTVVLSHLVFTQPFVILIMAARMMHFDFAVVDSAQDLGASPMQAFSSITLPLVAPTIVGAAMLATALSLDDFLVTFFTIGGQNTLPVLMWGMLRKGVDPSINVVASAVMILSIAASVIGLYATRFRG